MSKSYNDGTYSTEILHQQSLFQVAADNGSYNNLKWLEDHYFNTNPSEKQKTATDLLQLLQNVWTHPRKSHENTKNKEQQTLPRIKHFKTMLQALDSEVALALALDFDTIKNQKSPQMPSSQIFTHCLESFSPLAARALMKAMPQYAKLPQTLKFKEQLTSLSAQDYHLIYYCGREIEAAITQKNNLPLDEIIELTQSVQNKEFLPLLLNRMGTLTESANQTQAIKWQEIRLRLLAGISPKTQKFKI